MGGNVEAWATEKKVQCCLMENKGCPTTPSSSAAPVSTTPVSTTTPCPIDCNAGYNDLDPLQWVRGWSGEKALLLQDSQQGLPIGAAPALRPASIGCPSGARPERVRLRRRLSPLHALPGRVVVPQ